MCVFVSSRFISNSDDIITCLACRDVYSTPYKRWSKGTMEKVGGMFLQELRGKWIKFPLQKLKSSILALMSLIMYWRSMYLKYIPFHNSEIRLHCTEVSSYDCCHQMSDFKAKMHRIRFRLSSAPDPAGKTYSAPQTP